MSAWKRAALAAAIGLGATVAAHGADLQMPGHATRDAAAPERAPQPTPKWDSDRDSERGTSNDNPGVLAEPDPATQPDASADLAPPPGTVPSRKVGGALIVRPMTSPDVTPGDSTSSDVTPGDSPAATTDAPGHATGDASATQR